MKETSVINIINTVLFRSFVDAIPMGICAIDVQGNVIIWNTMCEKIHQVQSEKALGKPLKELKPGSKLSDIMHSMLNGENKEHYINEQYNVIMSVSLLYDSPNGEPVGCLSVEQDITAYRKINDMLEEASHNIRLLKKELNQQNRLEYSFEQIKGDSLQFKRLIELCKGFSHSNATVLLQGESGTGKELFARAMHVESGRKGAFIPVNCSAIPASLFESELFGYERGTFTGADRSGKIGYIEAANQGTLFLDEIGELPMEIQPKILRVLEDGVVVRIGAITGKRVDVRIICATNRDLKAMSISGDFRSDLYYRISTLTIPMIPLRERKEDILVYAEYFLEMFCKEYNVKYPEITNAFIRFLHESCWEGNIRELKNCIERIVIMMKINNEAKINPQYLPYEANYNKESIVDEKKYGVKPLGKLLEEVEKSAILDALEMAEGNITKAAQMLELPRTSLYYKLRKYGIEILKEISM